MQKGAIDDFKDLCEYGANITTMKRRNNIDRLILIACITIAIAIVAYTKESPKKVYDVLIDGTSKTVVQAYDYNSCHTKGERVIIRRRSEREPPPHQYFFANRSQIKHLEIDRKKYTIVIIQDTAVVAYTGTVIKNY
jgi:hypothetical protein